MTFSTRLGEYEEAEKRLANAFATSKAAAGSCQGAGNAASARAMVAALEQSRPINLPGLQQWWQQVEQAMQVSRDVSMSPGDFLQVSRWPLLADGTTPLPRGLARGRLVLLHMLAAGKAVAGQGLHRQQEMHLCCTGTSPLSG